MEIKYTSHAIDRMVERRISTDEVERTLLNPDGKIQQSLDKWIYYRNDNLIATVIVEKKGTIWEVVTVMINFEVLS